MRVLVHDFSGHPFQIDLSRRLASRGHVISHVHCASYTSGKGRLESDERLQVTAIQSRQTFDRYSPLRRLFQELSYGIRFLAVARQFKPDVIISCNDPLGAKLVFGLWSQWNKIPWVFWLQDLYSVAMSRELQSRQAPFGRSMGRLLQRIEGWLLRSADAVVAITDDFMPMLQRWGVDLATCTVVENWAPIDEIPVRDSDNTWRSDASLGGEFVLMYSGTLGLKHDPDVLYALADQFAHDDLDVVVVSEGIGIDRLRELQSERRLPNLRLFPFQPYTVLPDVLGAADVLLVLLEPAAGQFSVPSKVLSCMCAGRPILAMMPAENLAARTIERTGSGKVIPPGDRAALFEMVTLLMRDESLRKSMGQKARAYAEITFQGETIADRFEAVLMGADASQRFDCRHEQIGPA